MSLNARSAIVRGHAQAVRTGGTEVAVHRLTYASADDPFDVTQQHTVSETWRGRATIGFRNVDHQPVPTGDTYEATVTINARAIGWEPTVADRVEVGGRYYSVVRVKNVLDTVYLLDVAGETADPSSVADETPPRFTAMTLTTGETAFTYSGTINESAEFRYRYRKPAFTGTWITTNYNGLFSTTASGTSVVLDSGVYEVAFQPRDAAGNEGDWYDAGTVTITGVLG